MDVKFFYIPKPLKRLQAYSLTPEEIDLMGQTAPPRMTFPRPQLGIFSLLTPLVR